MIAKLREVFPWYKMGHLLGKQMVLLEFQLREVRLSQIKRLVETNLDMPIL